MPITLGLSPDSAGEVRFAVSPLVELGWAWHVLVGVDHHPDREDWAADVLASLPAEVTDALDAWSFVVRAVRATVLVDPTVVPNARWADQLAYLKGMPGNEFAATMLRPLLRVRGRPDNLAERVVREEVVGLARARGPAAVRVVRLILEDPPRATAELVALLERCWSLFLRADWKSTEPLLRKEIQHRTRLCARDGWPAAVRELSPAMTVGRDGRIVLDKMQSKSLAVAGRGLVLVPTTFGGPHLYVTDEPGRPIVVHYPYPAPPRAADRRAILRTLAVLANPARLEICRAIAVEPRSAREIARLWRFTETSVTKHLSAMRAAGLVRTERVGHFVRYSLDTSAIEALGTDLLDVLRR